MNILGNSNTRAKKVPRVRREYVQASAGVLALVLFSAAFGSHTDAASRPHPKGEVRLAYFPNLTHAPALIGVADSEFQNHLPGYELQTMVVNAGPEAMEALLAGAIDMAYVGPSPALNTYMRSKGTALKIVGGVCLGGASLVARQGVTINGVRDLAGHRIAVPEIGGTQDVSLRHFLKLNGLSPKEVGGDVEIVPIKNPDILALFKQGQLDAAWVPEPWASRLAAEANARVVVDERSLWPNGRFTTTVIVASQSFLKKHPDAVQGVLDANREIIGKIQANPAWAESEANQEIGRLTGKPLTNGVLKQAWTRLSFSPELQRDNLAAFASAAIDAGYLKDGSLAIAEVCEAPSGRLAANR